MMTSHLARGFNAHRFCRVIRTGPIKGGEKLGCLRISVRLTLHIFHHLVVVKTIHSVRVLMHRSSMMITITSERCDFSFFDKHISELLLCVRVCSAACMHVPRGFCILCSVKVCMCARALFRALLCVEDSAQYSALDLQETSAIF